MFIAAHRERIRSTDSPSRSRIGRTVVVSSRAALSEGVRTKHACEKPGTRLSGQFRRASAPCAIARSVGQRLTSCEHEQEDKSCRQTHEAAWPHGLEPRLSWSWENNAATLEIRLEFPSAGLALAWKACQRAGAPRVFSGSRARAACSSRMAVWGVRSGHLSLAAVRPFSDAEERERAKTTDSVRRRPGSGRFSTGAAPRLPRQQWGPARIPRRRALRSQLSIRHGRTLPRAWRLPGRRRARRTQSRAQ